MSPNVLQQILYVSLAIRQLLHCINTIVYDFVQFHTYTCLIKFSLFLVHAQSLSHLFQQNLLSLYCNCLLYFTPCLMNCYNQNCNYRAIYTSCQLNALTINSICMRVSTIVLLQPFLRFNISFCVLLAFYIFD